MAPETEHAQASDDAAPLLLSLPSRSSLVVRPRSATLHPTSTARSQLLHFRASSLLAHLGQQCKMAQVLGAPHSR